MEVDDEEALDEALAAVGDDTVTDEDSDFADLVDDEEEEEVLTVGTDDVIESEETDDDDVFDDMIEQGLSDVPSGPSVRNVSSSAAKRN